MFSLNPTFIAALLLFATPKLGMAQVLENGCLRLLGSVACPGFSYAYISPSNLSNAFPFFSAVTDVASFDTNALEYFSNPFEFQTTKFGTGELGCTGVPGNASVRPVIRYERTVLCSQWVNEVWSSQCLAFYNGTSAATSQKMVCQDTCLEYAASEVQVVNDTSFCPGTDLTGGTREATLYKDYVDCTNWTSLATNISGSCISGASNEPNCGYGSSTTQLCNFCHADTPDSCCYDSNTDISVCGFVLPAQSSTSSSGTASPTSSSGTGGSAQDNAGSTKKLTGGKLAGVIVGAVLGGLLLLAALLLLLLCCRRKRRQKTNNRDSNSSFAAATPATGFGGLFASHNRSSGVANTSEKGLLNKERMHGNNSSPTMGGDTLYSGHKGSSAESGAMLTGAAVGAGAAAAGVRGTSNVPGDRTSGVVLPRVRDENQGGERWIETGAEVTVLWPYQASLPDELDLSPGMKIRVLRLYDDAWGTAQVVSGGDPADVGRSGAFPIVCVSEGSTLGSATSSSDSH